MQPDGNEKPQLFNQPFHGNFEFPGIIGGKKILQIYNYPFLSCRCA